MLFMDLCPKSCLTWRMSLVLWYSMVAFVPKGVKCYLVHSGVLSFAAILLRWRAKFLLIVSVLLLKTLSEAESFGIELSILASLFDIFRFLGFPPLSTITLTVLFTRSMSVHFSWRASPYLTPVSLS